MYPSVRVMELAFLIGMSVGLSLAQSGSSPSFVRSIYVENENDNELSSKAMVLLLIHCLLLLP